MRLILLASVALASAAAGSASADSPVGSVFPAVQGKALDRTEVRFPDDTAGAPAVLLVAYTRGTQPDVDRWASFISTNAPELTWYEVPTIRSAMWRPLASWIDNGMRNGVDEELWPRVVTLYDDAKEVARFVGVHAAKTTHVVVLDPDGRVAWFHAGGYSDAAARELVESVTRIRGGE